MAATRKVYIVDDDPAGRAALVNLLSVSGFVVRDYGDPREFLAEVEPTAAGCLLLDLRMQEIDGIDVQRELVARGYAIPTVIVTAYGDVSTTVCCMKLGAMDVLEKPYAPEDLLARVRQALAIETHDLTRAAETSRILAASSALTPREREVCTLLIKGLASKEIAFELGIRPRTAQLHRERVLSKLGLRGAADLVRVARSLLPRLAR